MCGPKENIFRNTVPGSFELTLGAQFLAQYEEIDAVICIDVAIKPIPMPITK